VYSLACEKGTDLFVGRRQRHLAGPSSMS